MPPVTLTVADPSVPFKHVALAVTDAVAASAALGCVTVAFVCAVQLFASVTVTVYVPAANPVAVKPV